MSIGISCNDPIFFGIVKERTDLINKIFENEKVDRVSRRIPHSSQTLELTEIIDNLKDSFLYADKNISDKERTLYLLDMYFDAKNNDLLTEIEDYNKQITSLKDTIAKLTAKIITNM